MENNMTPKLIALTLAGTFVLAPLAAAQDFPPPAPEGPRAEMGQHFAEMDANNDGAVSRQEVDAFERAKFAEADTNNDGLLSTTEMAAAAEKRREEMRRRMEERRQQKMLERLDTNGDGQVSEAEFLDRPNPRFDLADSNDDGVIDAEEREAMASKAKRRGERWGRGGNGMRNR